MEHKIYGLYDDDTIMVDGAKSLIANGVKVKDAYSPFPVHGIEEILGIPWTRLAVTAFIFGITGTTLGLTGMYFFMIQDWPMNIGGKPSFSLYENLPAFIPVTFEFTVLCAAHLMAITYFLRNWTLPGVEARNPHPRTTDDGFALEVDPNDNSSKTPDQIKAMLKETGAIEVFEK